MSLIQIKPSCTMHMYYNIEYQKHYLSVLVTSKQKTKIQYSRITRDRSENALKTFLSSFVRNHRHLALFMCFSYYHKKRKYIPYLKLSCLILYLAILEKLCRQVPVFTTQLFAKPHFYLFILKEKKMEICVAIIDLFNTYVSD